MHASSGTRGNKKIGFSGKANGASDASKVKEKTSGGKSHKSATAYKCHNSKGSY
jgi:hypothetical protein